MNTTLPCILHVRGLRLSPTVSQSHTFRQYLYWLAFCYRWVVSGVDVCLSRNLHIQLHHKMHRLTTVRLFAQGESLALWLSVRCHLCSFCMFAAAVSLDLHTVWRSVSGRLLRSNRGSGEITTTLQHVFTCWASTVTQKRGCVKLLLGSIKGYY